MDILFQTVWNIIFFLYRIAPYRYEHPFTGRVILAFGIIFVITNNSCFFHSNQEIHSIVPFRCNVLLLLRLDEFLLHKPQDWPVYPYHQRAVDQRSAQMDPSDDPALCEILNNLCWISECSDISYFSHSWFAGFNGRYLASAHHARLSFHGWRLEKSILPSDFHYLRCFLQRTGIVSSYVPLRVFVHEFLLNITFGLCVQEYSLKINKDLIKIQTATYQNTLIKF